MREWLRERLQSWLKVPSVEAVKALREYRQAERDSWLEDRRQLLDAQLQGVNHADTRDRLVALEARFHKLFAIVDEMVANSFVDNPRLPDVDQCGEPR